MRLSFTLLFLGANVLLSDANIIARGTESIAATTHNPHKRAAQHSAGLANNIRRAFPGKHRYSRATNATSNSSKRAYCVAKPNKQSQSQASTSTKPTDGDSDSGPDHTTSSNGPASTASGVQSPYKLRKSYQGDSFFDEWDFFTAGDPTNGAVDYVDQKTAQSSNLIDINSDGRAIMRVETTPQVSGYRKSVRITTQFTYTGGLVLMDAVHMPTGCGTWPAFWSNGPNWPQGGEIDIVEGVNANTRNQATIHTGPGCTITSSTSKLGISGSVVGGTNCDVNASGNAGCGMVATESNSYGAGFNNNNGGVFAMQWNDDGITVWFFPRDEIPSDISANAPLPDTWGTPMAHWPQSSCHPFQFFHDHSAIFDTTLCGDWAGNVWNSGGCAASTGVSSCEAYVQSHGNALKEAYWEVNYVKMFQ